VLQCVAGSLRVLQWAAARGSQARSSHGHTATHCNTLQHTATHGNTLQHTATHCNTLQHTRVAVKVAVSTETEETASRVRPLSQLHTVSTSHCLNFTLSQLHTVSTSHCLNFTLSQRSSQGIAFSKFASCVWRQCVETLPCLPHVCGDTSKSRQCVAAGCSRLPIFAMRCNVLQYVACCCSVLQCCCSVVAVCCSVVAH